ncbi:MAG TPA: hypothetical protein VFL91_25430 [Thermomicrobiales bacterium]|nr:hypothetical protein [Thermomicrobiales bacterium]
MLAAAVPAAPARADVIPPGQKGVGYCFEVANLAAYPDAVVLAYYAYGTPSAAPPASVLAYTVVRPGACASFYKGATARFAALPRAAFDPAAIPRDGEGRARYFATDPHLARAALMVMPISTVDQRDPRTAVVDVLAIAGLTATTLDLRLARVRYTYVDGSSEELPYTGGDRPAPHQTARAASPSLPSSPAIAPTATATAGGLPATLTPGGTPTPVLVPDAPATGGPPPAWFAPAWYLLVPALAAAGLAGVLWRRRGR